ncbi:MAG: hypothetical protein L3K06_06655, partial [Thermoplasmata archaeon]|nr:hypothetical protein [Thermoplasmata archaeon]
NVTGGGIQWVAPGTVVQFSAVADPSMVFLAWNGTGGGNYTGVTASGSVTVNGPITEQVSFGPKPVTTTSSTSSGNGMLTALGLLVALLVAGLVVGLLVGRRRSPPPMTEAPAATSPEEEAPMDTSDAGASPPMAEYDEGPPSS